MTKWLKIIVIKYCDVFPIIMIMIIRLLLCSLVIIILIVNHNYAINARYYYDLHYPVYQNDNGQYYSFCSFDWNQTCGYRPQPNTLPFYVSDEIETLSSLGMMIFDVSKVDRDQASGARISGRFYPAYNFTRGCLMIKSLTYGPAISNWILRQRDRTDRILYHYTNNWQSKMARTNLDEYWTFLSLPIDLRNGGVQFFFDVHVDTKTHATAVGLMAIDFIAFLYEDCCFMQSQLLP